MTDAEIRASLKGLLEAVTGSGIIHEYERFATDSAKFLELFKTGDGRIHGWEITRTSLARPVKVGGSYRMAADYRVKGYYALKDAAASELAFNAVVDAMVAKVTGKKIPAVKGTLVAGAEVIGTRVFGNVLCHYAEIVIPEITWHLTPEQMDEQGELITLDINYYLKPGDDVADAADTLTTVE